ncbi:MAG: TetR/AcrR family transcriptional regulator [Coriobacteriia bacterium]|nr:TetR/AcrR family transcriptional regulator [Coriobacteriia bacterium]
MPRPRYETGEKTARERLEDAFWACLAEKPFDKITVADVTKRASVNRNTFYYHYEDMNDLARTVARETALEPERITSVLAHIFRGGGSEVLARIPDVDRRADCIYLLAGKNSNAELRQMLRDALIDTWSQAFSIDFKSLDLEGQLAIEFVLGGIMAIIAYRADGHDFRLHDLYDLGFTHDAMHFLRHVPSVHEQLAATIGERA